MKIALTATELTDTTTNIVSMVKRGANRIPFRIVKEDTEEMLDLHKISRQAFAKSEPAKKGGVLAVIVNKSADLDAVKETLGETFSFAKGDEGEDTIVFKQEGIDEFDVGMLQIDENVVIAVSGLQKSFSSYNWEETDFKAVFSQQSFYPTLYQATEAFRDTVANILYKTENKTSVSTLVSKACTDFGTLVNTLITAIPEAAIKAEELIKGEDFKAKKKPAAEEDEGKTPAKKEDEAVVTEETVEKTDEPEATDPAAEETQKTDATTEETVKTETPVDPNAGLADLIAQSIAKAIEPLTAATTALKNDLGKVNTRVEEVATIAQKSEKAINGTVIASSHGDRTVSTVKKTDTGGAPPLLDTAYGRPE